MILMEIDSLLRARGLGLSVDWLDGSTGIVERLRYFFGEDRPAVRHALNQERRDRKRAIESGLRESIRGDK